MSDNTTLQLTCMKIWGGNSKVHRSVELEGVNAWVYCDPHGESSQGGDIHYMSCCATGRVTRILVADVSGHGASVAEHAVKLKNLVHRYSNYISQQKLVRDLNRSFADYTTEGKFATAVAMTYFSPTGMLTYSNAGHPTPFIYKSSLKQWGKLETDGKSDSDKTGERTDLPFGIIDNAVYSQNQVKLEFNDLVLLYTDSLIDARGADGERLGVDGALALLEAIPFEGDHPSPGELIEKIKAQLHAIDSSATASYYEDDVTLLLFSPSLIGNVKWMRKLAAPWLLLKSSVQSLLTKGKPIPWPEFSLRNIGGSMVNAFNKRKK